MGNMGIVYVCDTLLIVVSQVTHHLFKSGLSIVGFPFTALSLISAV